MTGRQIILVMSLEEMPEEDPLVPSEKIVCSICAGDAWVSKTMYPYVQNGELEPICSLCIEGVTATLPPEEKELGLHDAQKDELRALGVLDIAERFIKKANKEGR